MYEIPLRCPEKTRCWLEIRSACVEHEHSLLQHSHLHQWLILPGVKLGQRSTFSQTRQVRAHSFSPPSFHSFYPWLGLRMLWEHSPPSTLSTQVNLLCSGNIQRSSSDAEGRWGSGGTALWGSWSLATAVFLHRLVKCGDSGPPEGLAREKPIGARQACPPAL